MRRTTPRTSVAAAEYVQQRGRRSGGSRGVIRGTHSITARLARHVNDRQVATITAGDVEDFFYAEGGLASTCSATTLGKYRNEVKQFLAFCHRRGWTTHTADFLVGGVSEKTTASNRNRYRMTRAELRRLIDAAEHPRDRALAAFCANTACRISEAKEMRIRDVSFVKGELYLHRVKTKQEVTFPLTSDLERELRVWLTVYTEQVGQLQKDFRLFPAFKRASFTDGRQHVTQILNPAARLQNESTVIQPMAERAGLELEPGDGWHTIRRSVARIFFDDASRNGFDAALRMTQALLGHKEAATTERYLGLLIEQEYVSRVLKGKPFITLDVDESDATIVNLDLKREAL